MSTNETDRTTHLLNEVFSEHLPTSVTDQLRSRCVQELRHSRRNRRRRWAASVILTLLLVSLWQISSPVRKRTQLLTAKITDPVMALESGGAGFSQVPTLTDEQLLAVLPPNCCFLATVDSELLVVEADAGEKVIR